MKAGKTYKEAGVSGLHSKSRDRNKRTKNALVGYVHRNRAVLNQFTDWTDEEIEFLKANRRQPKAWLGKALSRTPFAIQNKMRKLGLNRDWHDPILRVIKDEFYAFLELGVSIIDACKAGNLNYAAMRSDVSRRKRRGGVTGSQPKLSAETGVSNGTAGVPTRHARAGKEGRRLRATDRQEREAGVSHHRAGREDGSRCEDRRGAS